MVNETVVITNDLVMSIIIYNWMKTTRNEENIEISKPWLIDETKQNI